MASEPFVPEVTTPVISNIDHIAPVHVSEQLMVTASVVGEAVIPLNQVIFLLFKARVSSCAQEVTPLESDNVGLVTVPEERLNHTPTKIRELVDGRNVAVANDVPSVVLEPDARLTTASAI